MKKFIALALTLVMALSLVACGNSNSDNSGDNAADNNGGRHRRHHRHRVH